MKMNLKRLLTSQNQVIISAAKAILEVLMKFKDLFLRPLLSRLQVVIFYVEMIGFPAKLSD